MRRILRPSLFALLTTLTAVQTTTAQADTSPVAVTALGPGSPYAQAGIAPLDRAWRGPDYSTASSLISAQKAPLPRYSDPDGAALLARLTTTDNLAYDQAPAQPLETRLADFAQILRATNAIGRLYASSAELHQEMAAITVFQIKAAAIGNGLADEMVRATPKDTNYNTNLASVQRIRRAFVELYLRGEFLLSTDRKTYAPTDLSNIIQAMSTALPGVLSALNPDSQHVLAQRLKADSANYSDAADNAALQKMIALLGG